MMKNFDLTGKMAVITGGTGVLGGAMAKALADAGANVAILGRDEKKAADKVQQINEENGEAISLIADVLDRDALLAAKEKVLNKWETIDIIVNAAGGNTPKAIVNPDQSIYDLSRDALENIVNVNFLGSFYATRVFANLMIEQKSGSIVNISSMA